VTLQLDDTILAAMNSARDTAANGAVKYFGAIWGESMVELDGDTVHRVQPIGVCGEHIALATFDIDFQ